MNEGQKVAALRILVVEDEYLVADHIAYTLEHIGYTVVGPVPTVAEALALIESEAIDGALLDANLDGESSGPVAELLSARNVPFVVCTGYGVLKLGSALLEAAPRIGKPYTEHDLAEMMATTFAR